MSEPTDRQIPTAHAVRLEPIPTDEWSEEVREAMAVLPPEMVPAPGQTINSLSILAHNPAIAAASLAMTLHLRFGSTISDRDRELLILRTAYRRGAEYELRRHARNARRYGMADADIARIADGPDAPGWEPADALLVRAVDELCDDYRLGDATWNALRERYTIQEIMDVLFTVGTYDGMAMAFNTLGLQVEADIPPFPTGA